MEFQEETASGLTKYFERRPSCFLGNADLEAKNEEDDT